MSSKKENSVIEHESKEVSVAPSQDNTLIKLALENRADISTIEKLVNLQTEFEAKEARKAFFAAMSKLQSNLPVIEKKGTAKFDHRQGGGTTEYSFAKLDDIAKALKPLLYDHGFSYRYEQTQDNGIINVTCVVTHESGHEERMSMSAMADQSGKKNAIQQVASTVSYLRRYTLTGAFGISTADEDNDAQTYDEPQQTGYQSDYEYYPDSEFNKQFPAWEKQILSGNKTAERIISYLSNKGVNLSAEQTKQIKNVGA